MVRFQAGGVTEVSGQTVIAKISGETIVAKISGETVTVGGSVVAKISGETVIAKVSGETLDVNIASSGIMVPVDIQGAAIDVPVTGGPIIAKVSGETVDIVTPTTIQQGYKIVAAAATQLGSGVIKTVTIRNLSGNDVMWVGGSTVNSGSGYILFANEGISIDIDNLNKVYLYANTSGQYVAWIAVG